MPNVVISQSLLVSRAATYIQEKIVASGCGCTQSMIDEAAMRFNLSPAEAAALERVFREEKPD